MPRLFVGIAVPDEYKKALDSLVGDLGGRLASDVRWTRAGNWHVTLQFLGSVDEEKLDEIRAVLRGIEFQSFSMQAGGIGCFPGVRNPRILWLGMRQGEETCLQLADVVKDAMDVFGFKRGDKSTNIHLTLGRVKRLASDDFAGVFEGVRKELPEFSVDRFTLWESELTSNGPVYTVVEEFLLGQKNS